MSMLAVQGKLSAWQTDRQVFGLYKEKFVILQSKEIIAVKGSETRAVIYTCRYSSGHFNP